MTDREWRATHCIECYRTDPDEGWHERCGCHESAAGTSKLPAEQPVDNSPGHVGSIGENGSAPGGNRGLTTQSDVTGKGAGSW